MNNSTHFLNKKNLLMITHILAKMFFEDPDFHKIVLIVYLNVSTNKSPMMLWNIQTQHSFV